ncbi:unnamed protein product, partial [marine sediment metagenome]
MYYSSWFGFKIPDEAPDGTYTIITNVNTGPYQGNLTAICSIQVGNDTTPPPGPDNFVDLGNPADEAFHNLQGWGNAQG